MCLVSHTGKEMVQYVRSFTEWMGGTITKEQEAATLDPGNKNHGKRKRDEDDEDATNISLKLR